MRCTHSFSTAQASWDRRSCSLLWCLSLLHFDSGLTGPAPNYWIRRSARWSTSGGIVMPMSRAVLRFTISS